MNVDKLIATNLQQTCNSQGGTLDGKLRSE